VSENENVFKALSDFDVEDLQPEATICRRMLSRLEDIENPLTAGPVTPGARAALASSVIAHAVIELEHQLIELRKELADRAI
jgi:hypothetical protein